MHLMPGAGHLGQLDAPGLVLDLVRDFLSGPGEHA